MKFVDQVRIEVKAGDGGNGAVAFRREKYVERGGPSGGDGANGGSVIFEANPQLTTLLDFRYQPIHKAPGGEQGRGSDCNGRGGEDLVLQVPVGTLLKDIATEEIVADMSEPGQRFLAAKGGRGGLGNMNYATSTRQTPRFAQDGTAGEERTLMLELKLLADVGLLGYPNAGKSTLISRVSRARPKIADYPFTTLVPNLGVVAYKDNLSFVMADIPGLIEGASEGAGLGLQFLRHVERCRVLIHVLDCGAQGDGRDPLKDFEILNRELERYSPELATKPQVVAANKMDLPYAREKLEALTKTLNGRGLWVFPISSATGEGIPALLDAAARVLFGGGLPELPPGVFKKKAAGTKAVKAAGVKASATKTAPAKAAAAKVAAAKKPAVKKTARTAPLVKRKPVMTGGRKTKKPLPKSGAAVRAARGANKRKAPSKRS